MELPRIASQTSICQPSIQLLTSGYSLETPRTPASKRLLSASANQEPQFAVLPSASSFQPSRKKEEARALQNLRKRLQAVRVVQANTQHESVESTKYNGNGNGNANEQQLDNRPQLFQKVS